MDSTSIFRPMRIYYVVKLYYLLSMKLGISTKYTLIYLFFCDPYVLRTFYKISKITRTLLLSNVLISIPLQKSVSLLVIMT